jgi:hypothetical protein
VDDVDELIGLARDLTDEVVAVASELLLTGADIERVHSDYVVVAVELLSDAEAHGVLAVNGDQSALAALARIASVLDGLREGARSEVSAQEGDGRK